MLHELEQTEGLTSGVEILLNSLNPEIPQAWKDQARLVASYFHDLESGSAFLSLEERKLLGQLGNSDLVWSTRLRGNARGLPKWLDERWLEANRLLYESAGLQDNEIWQVQDAHRAYVQSRSLEENRARYGVYHYFPNVPEMDSAARAWKTYINYLGLYSLVKKGMFGEVLDSLVRSGVSPHSMKLAEDDLVLYFSNPINSFALVREIVGKYEVTLRGPAQDVITLQVAKNGSLKEEVSYSNDTALGPSRNPFDLELDKYSAAGFLKKYLRVCLWAGKNPARPYETSFVYILDKEGMIPTESRESVKHGAKELIGYPAVYTTHRMDFKLTRFDQAR